MKKFLFCVALMATSFTASASAQTCASPYHWTPGASGVPAWTGDTCVGGETGILSLCEAAQDAHGHAYVARFTSAAAGTYSTIAVNSTGFTAYLAVVALNAAGACNGNGDTGHCATTGDAATPVQHANVPAGDYYLIISNSGADAPTACGIFTLVTNGFLPVTLQEFTVS